MNERNVIVSMEEGLTRGVLYESGMLNFRGVTYSPSDDEDLPRSVPDSDGEEIDINILVKYFPPTDLEIQIAKPDTPSETLSGEKISI